MSRRALALLAVPLLAFAGCGGGDGGPKTSTGASSKPAKRT